VALKEASQPSFKKYGQQVVKNAKALASELINQGFTLCSGGTDTHLILIDLRNQGISGKLAAEALEAAGIIVNYNSIPYDPSPPFFPSGLRLGTPAVTSQGMKEKQMKLIADWMREVLKETGKIKREMSVSLNEEKKKAARFEIIKKSQVIKRIKEEVKKLCRQFPIKTKY
jgi:glycine hydroxymethyltransferase